MFYGFAFSSDLNEAPPFNPPLTRLCIAQGVWARGGGGAARSVRPTAGLHNCSGTPGLYGGRARAESAAPAAGCAVCTHVRAGPLIWPLGGKIESARLQCGERGTAWGGGGAVRISQRKDGTHCKGGFSDFRRCEGRSRPAQLQCGERGDSLRGCDECVCGPWNESTQSEWQCYRVAYLRLYSRCAGPGVCGTRQWFTTVSRCPSGKG